MHAEKWDSFITDELKKKIEHKLVPLFEIKKNEIVLDVGSGTGILLPYLKTATGKKGDVVALDFSRKMLDIAKKKFGNKFKYVKSNAEKTPFKNNVFDKIICFSVFPHFVHKLKVLKEFLRILKPQGKLIICHAYSRETINLHHSKVGGPVAKDYMPDNKKMRYLLTKAGFENINIIDGKDYYFLSCLCRKKS
jgi:ubiquinone/menaquinone biosynthesis C-methylase UbiE